MSCIVGYRAHREVLLSLLNLSFSGDAMHCHCGGLATTQSQVPRFFCGSFCIRHGKKFTRILFLFLVLCLCNIVWKTAFPFQSNCMHMNECMYISSVFIWKRASLLHRRQPSTRQEEGRQVSQPSDSCKISFPAGSCYRVASQTSILDHDEEETRMFSLFHSFNTITTHVLIFFPYRGC